MARGRRSRTAAGIFARRKPQGPSVALDKLWDIGPWIPGRRGHLSERAHQRMMERISTAVRAVEDERADRWGSAGASARFMEHVLDHLPATSAQLAVLCDLIDPRGRIGLAETSQWQRQSPSFTHGQVRSWTAALLREYARTREPVEDPAIGAIRDEVRTYLRPTYTEGVGENPVAHGVINSALYLSRYSDGPSFGTPDQLLRALDRDRPEFLGERDSDGADARAAVLAIGEWVADRLADGAMTDLTYADLGLDPAAATNSYLAHQHEVIRDIVWDTPLGDRDFAQAYLAQVGLTEQNLGPLADLMRPDADRTRLVTLAQGIRAALCANHGSALATPAHTAQLAAWLTSTPPNSGEPIHWFFECNHMRGVALRLSAEAKLHLHTSTGPGAATPGAPATTSGVPAPAPASPSPPAQVRSIRDAMTRR